MSKTVVSGLRPAPLWLGLAVTIATAAYVLVQDLRGDGLTATLLFQLVGALVYPIFYGCFTALLIFLARTFRLKDEWLAVSDKAITVGWQQFAADQISQIQVRSNWLGLHAIILLGPDGSKLVGTRAWPLDRPLQEVVPRLRTWLSEARSPR